MILPDDIAEPTIALKDQYFDLKGLNTYSSMGVGTIRDHIREGGLPSFKVKGKILVKRSEFDVWIGKFRLKKDLNRIADEALQSLKKQ